jgi:concanavalin A-like lectin/glucanase superfamily protein
VAAPVVTVEVAFTTDPLTTPGSWTDISQYVRELTVKRGRDHELSRTQAGEATLRLRNTDRRFDPVNGSSPYSPNVVPMRRIRIRATFESVTYDLFQGFVENWGQLWPPRPVNAAGDAECVATAVDAFKLLTLYQVANSYSQEVISDAPLGYWRLNEAAGSLTVADSGTVNTDLTTGSGAVLGVTPGPLLGGTSVTELDVGDTGFTNTNASASIWPYQSPNAQNRSFEAWVYPDDLTDVSYLFRLFDNAGNIDTDIFTFGDGSGRLEVRTQFFPGTAQSDSPTGLLVAGQWQHIACVIHWTDANFVDWYRNGAFFGRSNVFGIGTLADSWAAPTGPITVTVGGTTGGPPSWDGKLAHVAFYRGELSASRIASHYAVTLDDLGAQLTGSALGVLLDALGWPAGERTIDTGSSRIQQTSLVGSNLELALRIAEDTENGLLHMEGDGKVRFKERKSMPSATVSATFGDGGGAEVSYADLQVRYDDQDLYSRVSVTREGGTTALAEDATARTRYGPRTLDRSGLLYETDADAADAAGFLLARYSAPALRPVSMLMRSGDDSATMTQMLVRKLADRVSVARRPPGGGTVTMAAQIEGIAHHYVPGEPWETTFALVPVSAVSGGWLLEDAAQGLLESTTHVGW